MRIEHITASHFLSHRSLNIPIDPATRVLLICGDNGVGKTAIAQGLRMALTGEVVRGLKYKNQLSELITQGEREGTFAVTVNHDGATAQYTFNVRTGNYAGSSPPLPGHPAPLEPEQFIAMDAAARRKLLFQMAGIALKPEAIIRELVDMGHALEYVEAVASSLRNGFDAAAKRAAECATEARGGWKAVTGETYGDKKAQTWTASTPSVEGLEPLDELEAKLGGATIRFEKAKAAAESLKAAANAHANAGALREAQANLADNSAALAELTNQRDNLAKELEAIKHAASYKGGQTCKCPSCDTVLFWDTVGVLQKWDDAKPAMAAPQAHAAMQQVQGQLAALDGKLERVRQLVAEGKGAERLLASLPERPAPEAVTAANTEFAQAQAALTLVQADHRVAANVAQEQQRANERTAKAARFAAEVIAFGKLADAIPELPGRYLKAALGRVNELLEAPSKAFGTRVTLEADMELRYGTVPYALASDSQQWRLRAAIGYVLAVMGGLGVLVLDHFDVLQVSARGPVLSWLAKQTDVQVILCGTLKERPKLPEPPFQIAWLETPK